MAWEKKVLLGFNIPIKVGKIRNDFFKPTFLPKNEQTKSTLRLVDLFFFFIFWKKVKTPKRHFEIDWPLLKNILWTYEAFHSLKMTHNFWTKSRNSCQFDISRKSDRLPWIDSFHFLGSQSYTFSRPLALITMHKLSLSINGFPVLKFRHRHIPNYLRFSISLLMKILWCGTA